MEISQARPPVATASVPPQTAGAKPQVSSDFETFLRMLTVQMQNQDPLNPVDSNDFATQLATFSTVEQAVLTNDLLRNLTAQLGLSGMSDLAVWIGKDARTPGNAAYDGAPVTLYPNPAPEAQSGEIILRDSLGEEIMRLPTQASADPVVWDGRTADGSFAPPGVYAVSFNNIFPDGAPYETTVETYLPVTEVRNDAGQTRLILQGGAVISPGDITALRDAAS